MNFTELEIYQHEIRSTLLGMEFSLRWSKDTSLEMKTRLDASEDYENLCDQLRLKVRQLIRHSINCDVGIYEELLHCECDKLIVEVQGADEIRAYIAGMLLCEDLDGLIGMTDISPITELHEAANKWCTRGNFGLGWEWSRLFKSIENHKAETEYELTCQECGRVFDTSDELHSHGVVKYSGYPHAFGWDAPEIGCREDDDIPF